MPAAAVIPAPGVHGIIAETITSVVGITGPQRHRLWQRRLRATTVTLRRIPVRVRDLNQVIKTSSCSMVLHGIVERNLVLSVP